MLYIIYLLPYGQINPFMAKKPGRPKEKDKVKIGYVYLKKSQINRIERKHKTLTKALQDVVLPEC